MTAHEIEGFAERIDAFLWNSAFNYCADNPKQYVRASDAG